MKKLLFAFLVLTSIASCKKNNDDSPASLVGKWGIVNSWYKEVTNGATSYEENYTGVVADYIEFRTDGTAYSFVDGFTSNSTYVLQANNKVSIDGDTYDIQTLTNNSATLYSKVVINATNYTETKVTLKR